HRRRPGGPVRRSGAGDRGVRRAAARRGPRSARAARERRCVVMYHQTADPPVVAKPDLYTAAAERAAFWGYPAAGPWTVSLRLPGGERSKATRSVEVRRYTDGRTEVLS